MTTLALGVAGAAIGGYFGGGIGASIGWSLGAALGASLDPQKVQGPRLSDLKLQGSSYGAMEPILYGTMRLAGNVIALPESLTENQHTSGGGKGGSSTKTTTYTYSVQYVDVLICECPVVAMLKIWADGRLIFDGAGDVPVTFYTGADTQLPDPIEEAVYGVGLTPAYRGAGRAVFGEDWQLADYYNRVPQLEFLVATAEASTGPITIVWEDHTTHADDWRWAYRWTEGRVGNNAPRIDEWVYPHDGIDVTTAPYRPVTGGGNYPDLTELSISNIWEPVGNYVYADDTSTPLWISNPRQAVQSTTVTGGFKDCIVSGSASIVGDMQIFTGDIAWSHDAGIPDGEVIYSSILSQNCRILLALCSSGNWYKVIDGAVTDSGTIATLDPPVVCGPGGVLVTYDAAVMENNGRYVWRIRGNDTYGMTVPNHGGNSPGAVSLYWIDDDGVFDSVAIAGKCTTNDPGYDTGGSSPPWSGNFYPALCSPREGYCGVVIGISMVLFTRYAGPAGVYLWQIVGDLCRRCGLAEDEFDVTQLTDFVDGFIVSQQMTARAAIEALMPVFFFDATEADGKIIFVKRGGESVATIPDDDLAAHEDGQGLPATLSFVRKQEVDLPASISVVYFNPDAAYQLSTQTSQRMVTASETTTTINTTVVLTDDHARRIADALLYIAWLERDQYTFVTLRKYEALIPTDVVMVGGIELRIVKRTASDSGTIKFEAVRSYAPVFVQPSAGGPATGFVDETVTLPQATQLVMLDIPLLTNVTAQSILRPAMAGADRASWRGAALLKSIDGGSSYTEIIASSQPDVIGITVDALGVFGGGNIFDEINGVTVTIPNGVTLESAASDAVINGANEAVLGRELIQYRDATLTDTNTYTLTGLLRGRRGTEWAMASHVAGESFVGLPTSVEIPSLSSEFGTARQYKAVTIGSDVASAEVHDFTARGISVTPLAPVHPAAGIDGDGNWIMMWSRRARMNAAWLNFTEVPLDEASETYRVSLFTDVTFGIVAATYDCTGASFTFTVAQQTAVYGSPQTSEPPWTVAQIGIAGPGYDTLGRSPVVVAPPPPAPPPITPDIPLGDVQWHADYRYPDTTHANKNFNWLQDNYSSSWAWCYMYSAYHTQLSNDLVFDLGVEGMRIVNTMGMMGYYAPAGFMVPYYGQVNDGPTLHAENPDVNIPLPYPNDDST